MQVETLVGAVTNESSGLAVFFYLLAFLLVLLLTYFATKLIAKNYGFSSKGNIKVIERVVLGSDRTLLLYEMDTVYYLMYIHKNGAVLIDKRSDLNLIKGNLANQKLDFSEIMSKITKNEKGRTNHEDQE